MSLVINSNSGNGGYELSNENLIYSYPQVEGNILLFPENLHFIPGNVANNTAYSVNGTVVNAITGVCSAPDIYETRFASGAYPPCYGPSCQITTSTTVSLRIGTPYPIQSGLTIGKTVILGPKYVNTSYITSVEVKVGILHSDGTITYIATGNYSNSSISLLSHTFSGDASWGNGIASTLYLPTQGNIVSTQGFITQEGDYIIMDISIVRSAYSSGTPANNMSCGFGFPFYKDNFRPIQISID